MSTGVSIFSYVCVCGYGRAYLAWVTKINFRTNFPLRCERTVKNFRLGRSLNCEKANYSKTGTPTHSYSKNYTTPLFWNSVGQCT